MRRVCARPLPAGQTTIAELHDLARKYPDRVAEMERIMRREHVPNPTFPLPGIDK